MKGYGQFCAVARSLDVLGERWTLLVIRELMVGSTTFGAIARGLPRIPKATLAARLRTLRAAGLVEATDDGYRLTAQGAALGPVLRELAVWATSADGAALGPDDLDPAALTWDMQRRIDHAALPEHPVVVHIAFTDRPAPERHFWLHLSPRSVDLCRDDTGAPVDLWLEGPAAAITRWWLGELTWRQLLRAPGFAIQGDRRLQRELPGWFQGYVFSPQALAINASG